MVAADVAVLPYASAITTAPGDRPRYPVRTRQAVRDTPKAIPGWDNEKSFSNAEYQATTGHML